MRLLLFFSMSLLLAVPGWAQDRVRNIRIQVVDGQQLEILYDMLTARPGDSVYLAVRSRVRGELRILPQFVRGDVGERLTAGSNKRIVWEALANGYLLDEDVQATVYVKTGLVQPTTPLPQAQVSSGLPVVQPDVSAILMADTMPVRKSRYAGPAWALVSAVVPGVGNIFVQTPRPKIGLRPLVAVSCYGLLAYGLIERQKAQDQYALYEEQKNRAAGEPYYQTANEHHHRYFLATRGALVVAAADVILTFFKGLHNRQLQQEVRRFQSVTLRPGLLAGQPTAVVRFSF